RDHVTEGEVHAWTRRSRRLRHAMEPARDGVAGDDQQAARLEVDGGAGSARRLANVEPPRRPEADGGDVGLSAMVVIAVPMPAGAAPLGAIEVGEDRVVGPARDRLDAPADRVETR